MEEGIPLLHFITTILRLSRMRLKLRMAHLKDALFQMVNDPDYKSQKHELLTTHEKVIRAMKHLIKDFNLDLGTIEAFNTRHTLSNLSYLKNSKNTVHKKNKTRRNRH
jgi:hypothetical protein